MTTTERQLKATERYERERLAWDAWTLGEGSWDDMPRPPVRPYPYRDTRQQRNRRISTCHGFGTLPPAPAKPKRKQGYSF